MADATRLERLRERRRELEALRGAMILARIDQRKIELLEREIAELGGGTDERSKVMDAIKQLETVEKAVANAAADPARMRKAAEDIYDDVVKRIAASEGCDMRRAHYLAAKDPIGKRAYAQVVELQALERQHRTGAGRIAAYLG